MAGVGAPLMEAWQACGRDERGGRRRGQQGARPRGEGQQGEGHGGAAGLPLRALCFASCSPQGCCAWLSVVRERRRKQGEEGEEKKRRKREEKEKNMENFLNLKISKKIKDNL
jgi:hypothetical protein